MIGDLTIKLNADVGSLVVPIQTAENGLMRVADEAVKAQFNLNVVNTALKKMQLLALQMRVVNEHFAIFGKLIGGAAIWVTKLTAGVTAVGAVAFNAAIGLGVLLNVLRGIPAGLKIIGAGGMLIIKGLLIPFKLAFGVLKAFASALWMIAKPLLAVAKFVFMVKVAILSFKTQIQVIIRIFQLMPPKLRLIVGSLVALGIASRVSSTATRILGASITAATAAARVGTIAILTFVNPIAALKLAAISAGQSMLWLSATIYKVASSMASVGMSAITSIGSGLFSLASSAASAAISIGQQLVGAVMSFAKVSALVLVGATGWGIKLAADAEQAEVAFTTMLKSADAAKQILGELEQFAASTPFQLADLRDGAKQLLNAQVPTADLTNKLRMLGDIAAGTGKPIVDFVRIYSKVKSTGKVSLETLNQLAERGVPIYTALGEQLGKSRTEMLKMISSGKVGFADMNAALTTLATGTGVFAGGMEAQSKTIAGLWSTLKDNVSFAARELGIQVSEAFNFKGMLNNSITFFQGLKDKITAAKPFFIALASTAMAGFNAIWEFGSVAITQLGNLFGVNSGNMMSLLMDTLAVATFVFKSWPDIAEYAFTQVALFAVQSFANIQHFFTGVLPALFTWFGDNWRDVFYTAFDLATTVFINLGQNIRNAMSAIWEFIKSGGTSSLEFAWEPLTKGFVNTVKNLPDIPTRAIGSLESKLMGDVDRLGNRLGNDLQKEIQANMDLLAAVKIPESAGNATGTTPDGVVEPPTDAQSSTEKPNTGVLERGSAEAFKAIIAGQQRNAELNESKKQTKALGDIKALMAKQAATMSINLIPVPGL